MLDQLLLALQKSRFADWLAQGAFPPIITLHSVGLALLVGLQVVICVRVLGFAEPLPIVALRRFMVVVWIGFWANLGSGLLLFAIYAHKYFHSTLFQAKLAFIVAGLVAGTLLNRAILKQANESAAQSGYQAPGWTKNLAVLSLSCWAAAIVCGRWLAYSTYGDIGLE